MKPPIQENEFVPILGTRISRFGFSKVLDACLQQAAQGRGGYVCFANAHSLTEAKSDPTVYEALNGSMLSVADGVPLVWASKLKGQPIESRVCGPDLMKELLDSTKGELHGFIGGMPGQAEAMAKKFGLQAVCYSPPMRPFNHDHALEDWQKFLSLCPNRQPPKYVWIGLGAPKQERWMHAVSPIASGTLLFGVGAAYDFLTGTKRRAPLWMQNFGLEWLYRFTQEPGRLWKRYLVGNARFVFFCCKEILFERKPIQ
jgi:N-acetylglucosaminyldiphosphoundecaprenol N-acetyl-beta-D-mannosaminyltransferase